MLPKAPNALDPKKFPLGTRKAQLFGKTTQDIIKFTKQFREAHWYKSVKIAQKFKTSKIRFKAILKAKLRIVFRIQIKTFFQIELLNKMLDFVSVWNAQNIVQKGIGKFLGSRDVRLVVEVR